MPGMFYENSEKKNIKRLNIQSGIRSKKQLFKKPVSERRKKRIAFAIE